MKGQSTAEHLYILSDIKKVHIRSFKDIFTLSTFYNTGILPESHRYKKSFHSAHLICDLQV